MTQQSLSDEEFHRMQMQLIEIRTENYKLKDENKKNAVKLKELSERETKLDKELNKQMKMKKALSTLNKSKQAQEYEALLQQTEQEFALQNQTLMAELSKLSVTINKLEKENQQMKHEGGNSLLNSDGDSELRRLQAENKVLKNNIESMQLQHREELTLPKNSSNHSSPRASPRRKLSTSEQQQTTCLEVAVDDPLSGDSSPPQNTTVLIEEQLLHAEAQCERLNQQLQELQNVKVQYETEKEEKILVKKALEEAEDRNSREQRALENEVDAFREKLERKQAVCLELQHVKDRLLEETRAKSSEMKSMKESYLLEKQERETQMIGEINSLGKALKNAQNLVERHQATATNLQTQLETTESHKTAIVDENNKLKEIIKSLHEKEKSREHQKHEHSSQQRALEDRLKQLETRLERSAMERDDAVTKFEENARASGALLKQVNDLELLNENLRRELDEAKELAEKRKKVMDKQAVESQELSAKYTEQITALKDEHKAESKRHREQNEEKIELLENTCKKQEQELIRINHQDRAKTRELDTCQQQVRDMQAAMTSLENSKGWFERALKDAEEVAAKKEEEHQTVIEQTKLECKKEIERMTSELKSREELEAECDRKVALANEEASKRDGKIESLQQQIQDEINKQKLIEKKGHTSMKDLKRQLTNEKRRNEKLQEKLKELSSNNSNLDELLHVADDKDGDGSSTSSFSFRDLISSSKNIPSDNASQSSSAGFSNMKKLSQNPSVSKGETRELLNRITNLQQEKWGLEEQVKHLEESAAAMAQELLEKTKLMQDYVQHTRTDHHKQRAPNEELAGPSKKFSDRMKNIITGQPGSDVTNILELNRKLTRMLEEEMTKNMALKEHLAALTEQLANTK